MEMKRDRQKERGVAILFALGILGMMTVLALTFASISMTNQTIAHNSMEQYSAKVLSESIAQRIRWMLSKINTPQQLFNFYSNGGTNSADFLWKLGYLGPSIESALYYDGGGTIDPLDFSDDIAYQTRPTWQYIKNDGIIARFAYFALAAYQPVVDLNAMLFQENSLEKIGTRPARLGVFLYEMDPDWYLTAVRNEKNYGGSESFYNFIEKHSEITKRISFYSELEKFVKSRASYHDDYIFTRTFKPNSVTYPEVFLQNNTTAVYRFDLSQIPHDANLTVRRQWVNDMTSADDNKLAKLGSDGKTTRIPWLSDYSESDLEGGYTNEGDLYAKQIKAKQIAANIVDFVTSGTEPTWDSKTKNSDWFADTPYYIGLKKTPYLLGFRGIFIQKFHSESEEVPGTDPKQYKHTLNVLSEFQPSIEICNFMNFTKDIKVKYDGTVKIVYKYKNSSGEHEENETLTLVSDEIAIDKKNQGLQCILLPKIEVGYKSVPNSEITIGSDAGPYMTRIQSIEVTNLKIGLKFDDKWVDFAVIDTTLAESKKTEIPSDPPILPEDYKSVPVSPDSNTHNLSIAFRVSDPRHNLYPSLWKGKISLVPGQDMDVLARESTPDLPGNCDISNNPLKVASPQLENCLYIPQKTIITPWEIGQIHRGNSWQTINLKKFKDSEPVKGGSYSDGDANLLDQLRMTDASVYGKIPLNEIWGKNANALFDVLQRNARINENFTENNVNSSGNNDLLGNVNVSPFFHYRRYEASKKYFEYRGELTKLLSYSSSYGLFNSNPDSDAAKEELFAKCAMLFHAEPTIFPRRIYVFGIVQTIKDIEGKIYKKWENGFDFTETSKLDLFNAGYQSDMTDNPRRKIKVKNDKVEISKPIDAKKGIFDIGADKILSEQKFVIVLERDFIAIPTDPKDIKWRIVRFEYVY